VFRSEHSTFEGYLYDLVKKVKNILVILPCFERASCSTNRDVDVDVDVDVEA